MKIYFLSEGACALKIQGELVGLTGGCRQYLDLSLRDGLLVEWLPVGEGLPSVFILDERLNYESPKNVVMCRFPMGLALYFSPQNSGVGGVKLLFHAEDALLYRQGGTYLVLGQKTVPMPALEGEIRQEDYGGGIRVLRAENALVLYRGSNVLFKGKATELRAVVGGVEYVSDLFDLRARKGKFTWKAEGEEIVLSAFSVLGGKRLPSTFNLACLMDDVRLSAPFSGNWVHLEEERQGLKSYFGNCIAVVPIGENAAAGVYELKKGLLELRAFRAGGADGVSDIERVW